MSEKEIRLPDGLTTDEAVDVLQRYASTENATIVDGDTAETLDTLEGLESFDTLDSVVEELKEAKEAFASLLESESPQSADTLSEMPMDALTEPFRDDEGDGIQIDTLGQSAETSGAGAGGNDGDDFDAREAKLNHKSELETLQRKARTFENRGMDERAEELRDEAVDIADAPDYDTLEKEVLG